MPMRGMRLSGRKRMNSQICRNEKGAYCADRVGFPSRRRGSGASSCTTREGEIRSGKPWWIRTYSSQKGEGEGGKKGVIIYRIEDIDLSLVDEESLEQQRRDGRALSQHQEARIPPGQGALEDGQEGDLRHVGEDEEQRDDDERQDKAREQTRPQQRPKESMRREEVDALHTHPFRPRVSVSLLEYFRCVGVMQGKLGHLERIKPRRGRD